MTLALFTRNVLRLCDFFNLSSSVVCGSPLIDCRHEQPPASPALGSRSSFNSTTLRMYLHPKVQSSSTGLRYRWNCTCKFSLLFHHKKYMSTFKTGLNLWRTFMSLHMFIVLDMATTCEPFLCSRINWYQVIVILNWLIVRHNFKSDFCYKWNIDWQSKSCFIRVLNKAVSIDFSIDYKLVLMTRNSFYWSKFLN